MPRREEDGEKSCPIFGADAKLMSFLNGLRLHGGWRALANKIKVCGACDKRLCPFRSFLMNENGEISGRGQVA